MVELTDLIQTQTLVEIIDSAIDDEHVWRLIADVDCGAQNVFLGTTRRLTRGEETRFLVYDAYRPMAQRELERLAFEAAKRWELRHLVIVHRLGKVALGEPSVAIGASSPHRKDVFEAIPWILEQLKKSVPIWKQENWADGSTQWVHPS